MRLLMFLWQYIAAAVERVLTFWYFWRYFAKVGDIMPFRRAWDYARQVHR